MPFRVVESFEDRIAAIRDALEDLASDLADDGLDDAADQYVIAALTELNDIEQDLLKEFEVEFVVAVPFEATVMARDADDVRNKVIANDFASIPSGDVDFFALSDHDIDVDDIVVTEP